MTAVCSQSSASLSSSTRGAYSSADRALAFDDLYRDHFRFVWTSLLRLGVPRHAVEDALQETFLVVHRRLDDFEGRGSPRAWLFGIVRRVAFRSRRTRDRAKRKVSALALEHVSAAPLDDEVARRQLSALLLEALDELDDDKRAALTLHVFEELSGPQVAALLGLKVDTAYSRIKAGRRALQRVLATKGVDVHVARLVHATRVHTEPAPGTRRRVAASLLAGPIGSGGPVAASPWAPALLSPKALLLLVTLGVGSVFGVTQLATSDASGSTPASATAPSRGDDPPTPPRADAPSQPNTDIAAPAAEVAPQPVAPIAAEPTPPRRERTVAPAAVPVQPQKSAALQAEVALIERAITALRTDRPADALAVLHEHATTFPRGQLTTERRAYRAIALCVGGNSRQGRAEARLVLKSAPSNALRARVEDACGVTDAIAQ